MRTRIFTILLVCILPTVGVAQARLLRVISPDSQPVVYASIAVEGGGTRITDETGTVSLGAGKHQTLTVRVMRIGFKPWFGKIDLPDAAAVYTITLSPLVQALGPVTVTGQAAIKSQLELTGFYDRWMMRQKGTLSAEFISPEEIEFRHPDKISNMLFGLNGVCLGHIHTKTQSGGDRTTPNVHAFSTASGCMCPMAIVVDGIQQAPVPAIDDILDANDVAAIEVYARGGNMPISMQFNDTACGVVAFWTGSRRP
jgi:hypothetical protein